MSYLKRTLTGKIEKWLDRREIIAVKGPRQSGKTTMLEILKDYLVSKRGVPENRIIYLTFDDRDVMEAFKKDPRSYINAYVAKEPGARFYFLMDEFQCLKEGGLTLKLLYDAYKNIKFIITGSSSLEITQHTAKYLVGRVFSFNLFQFSFLEYLQVMPVNLRNAYEEASGNVREFLNNGKSFKVKDEDIFAKDFIRCFEEFFVFGGYPEVVKSRDRETKDTILKNIYDTYITKDIVGLLRIKDISSFRTVVSLLANQTGSLLNMHSLAVDSRSYFRQLKQYLSILEETFIIRNLKPYFKNKSTELKKNPKVYFVDTGLRNFTINNFNEGMLRADTGCLVENVVLNSFYQDRDEEVKFWRTLGQAEVDFIVEKPDRVIPIEVKYSSLKKPEINRSLRSFIESYKPPAALVLTKGFWAKTKLGATQILFVPAWYAI